MNLPKVEDFVCTAKPEDDLDGVHAWKEFGGLTVEEAYQKFCEVPENRQEAFMFMGNAAFVFYFPVIDRYIREEESENEFDGETHILGHCISTHISEEQIDVRPLYEECVELCHFVLQGLKNVAPGPDRSFSPEKIQGVWKELLEKTLGLMGRQSQKRLPTPLFRPLFRKIMAANIACRPGRR